MGDSWEGKSSWAGVGSTKPGRVFVYWVDFTSIGGKVRSVGGGGGSQSNAAKPFIQYSLLCLQVFLKNCYLSNSLGTLRLEPDKCIPRL